MTTYSPRQKAGKTDGTMWQLYERAAKAKYGRNIRVIKTKPNEAKVDSIPFQVVVTGMDGKPREVSRVIADINMKEYKNLGKEQDETAVHITNTTHQTEGSRHSFTVKNGSDFGLSSTIEANVMGFGKIGIGGSFNKKKEKTKEDEVSSESGVSFTYHQEEKITVPPGKEVKAEITTYSMKYEVDYTVQLRVRKDATLPVLYRTWCQHHFCYLCRQYGSVLVRDVLSTLPNYIQEDENGMVSLTLRGTLSWSGEGCSVEKTERDI